MMQPSTVTGERVGTGIRWRLALIAAVAITYLLGFPYLRGLSADIALALSVVPAGMIAWSFGMRAGFLAGLVTLVANLILFVAFPSDSKWTSFLFGSLLVMTVAMLIGHARDAGENLKAELIARDKTKKELERRNHDLSVLSSIAQSLADSIDTGDMLGKALASVLDSLHMDKGGVYLVSEDSCHLDLVIQSGIQGDSAQLMKRYPAGEGILGDVVRSGATSAFADILSAASESTGRVLKSEGIVSAVLMPLRAKGKTVGLLTASSPVRREFTSSEISLLDTIGGQIGTAAENARLFQKMSHLSLTDELTGLYNRRHFNHIIEAEMLRSRRDGKPFSLVLVDLDQFKIFNDKYGHQNGDDVLKAFSEVLQAAPRKTDTAFRLGGDEFSIILPGTSSEVAWKVVERIRSMWQAARLPDIEMEEIPVEFSVGVAEFPRDGEDAKAMIAAADATMYHSKFSKNASPPFRESSG